VDWKDVSPQKASSSTRPFDADWIRDHDGNTGRHGRV